MPLAQISADFIWLFSVLSRLSGSVTHHPSPKIKLLKTGFVQWVWAEMFLVFMKPITALVFSRCCLDLIALWNYDFFFNSALKTSDGVKKWIKKTLCLKHDPCCHTLKLLLNKKHVLYNLIKEHYKLNLLLMRFNTAFMKQPSFSSYCLLYVLYKKQ